jgi:hypothetical protein
MMPNQVNVLDSLINFTTLLRPILLFANTDVSTTKMCLDTSILAKSIMGRREYVIFQIFPPLEET